MIKKINIEEIKKREEFLYGKLLTRKEVECALEEAKASVKRNMEYLDGKFPFSAAYNSEPFPSERDGMYPITENVEWTTGFWTGLIWLMYDWSREECFKELGMADVRSFKERVDKRIDLNHHDLGFLYSPSCVAAYQLCQSEEGKEAALQAADILMERYRENGHFIQAWGNVGDPKDYRLIIDCMLNIPLLYWKSRVTGDERYEKAAREHFITSCNNVVRDDASAYHTFYFDPETGEPVKGVTRQGYSDDSAWARGQAWGIYGIALNYRNSGIEEAFDLFKGMTNYFLNRLPQDNVCYWDLIFGDGSGQSRDSSAAAVAVCGMQEMCKYLPETDEDKEVYKYAMHTILRSLIENYANHSHKPGEALLLHGVYSWHSGKGIDVGNIWGDYYYVEALVRFLKDWQVWW